VLLTGGGLVTLGSLVSGWLADQSAKKRDERKYDHELTMARETRHQERLEPAYMALLRLLSRNRDWADSVRPLRATGQPPEPLDREELWRIETLVSMYGSDEVRRLLQEWSNCAEKVERADETLRSLDKSKNPSPEFEEQAKQEEKALPDYKAAMHQADDAVRAHVRRELGGITYDLKH
jgi:hypothetical protein